MFGTPAGTERSLCVTQLLMRTRLEVVCLLVAGRVTDSFESLEKDPVKKGSQECVLVLPSSSAGPL